MKEFLDVQGGGKHPKHRYAMEQFGLTKARIESTSEPCRERFRAFF